MPDASPTKWHRAHTTWFFETFVLAPAGVAVGRRALRLPLQLVLRGGRARGTRAPKRGLLSRPTRRGDRRVPAARRRARRRSCWRRPSADELERALLPIVELGIAHEEQHQELLLTDILHAFSENPLAPGVPRRRPRRRQPRRRRRRAPLALRRRSTGACARSARAATEPFAFDNERPRHKEWVEPFALADRLVTVGELKAFIASGGYRTPSLWLSEGFDFVRAHGIAAPLYCTLRRRRARACSRSPARDVARDDEPLAHVSYYEADAIARFLGARLPDRSRVGGAPRAAGARARQLRRRRRRCIRCPRRGRRASRRRAPALRRRLGVDALELRAVPRLRRAPRARSASTTASSW